jgi:hypothetical protein
LRLPEGCIRILSPQGDKRERNRRETQINPRWQHAVGDHHTPQSPACMAGTGRAFICGASGLTESEIAGQLTVMKRALRVRGLFFACLT